MAGVKIFEQITDQKQEEIVIVLGLKEAQALYEALMFSTGEIEKKPTKRSKAYKVADELCDLMPVW